jgi:biopolymer transport protein ExbD
MRFATRLKPCTNLIDLTPLVDVIFLMLIFFLVTSEILPMKSLLIENPIIEKEAPTRLTQLLVVMDRDQVIYIGSKKDIVDLSSVKPVLQDQIIALKNQYPECNPTVVLSIDRRVDYGAFLRLFSQVQECTPRIRLSFKPKQTIEPGS